MMRGVTMPVSPEPVLSPGETLRPPPEIPFTVIDQSVHVLESAAEPWGIELELGLGQRLDEGRFRAAVRAALLRHPMARARQLPARRTDRTWWWQIAPEPDLDPVRVVYCPDDDAVAAARQELHGRPVPLVEAPPLRLWLARRPHGDTLLLNANHAAFDGFGCVRLLQSVAHAYTGARDPDPPVDLDEARQVTRHLAVDDPATRGRRFRLIGSKAADLVVRPTRLATDGGADRPGYGFHHDALGPEETAQLARDDGPTVNDVLLAALHLAIAGWNEEHGTRAGRIGILVPVNLRPKEWQRDVVTNFVLDARVLTSPDQRRDPRAVLAAIGDQSERIKQGGGAALIEAIGGWTSMPLWTKQPLSSLLWATGNRLVDTALLSNMGELKDLPAFGADDGEVQEAWFSAPARMPCGLSVGALTAHGRLHLSYRYRHPLLGPDAAARFARRYRAELERVAAA